MNIIENLYFILWVAGFVAFLIFFFHEHYKYKKFVDKLKTGVALQVTKYLINDEFDPGHTFTITIIQNGVSQVRVRYSDGSVETVDKYRLYEEKWKIVYADNVE